MRTLALSSRCFSRFSLLCSLLLVVACGTEAPMPTAIVEFRVATPAREVTLGQGFPLAVTRVWASGRPPGEWTEERLFPLYLKPDGTTTRDDGRFVEEVRRFTAYAFEPGKLVIPPPELVPDARERIALTVVPTLDAAAPGDPELPGDLLAGPMRWWPWIVGVLALAATGLLLRFRRRDAVPEVKPEAPTAPPPPAPHERALRRIERLRGISPEGRDAMQKWHVEAAAVVRDYLAERFGLPTARMTTQECVRATADLASVADEARRALRSYLGDCDGVKFARGRPDGAERSRMLDVGARFATDTAGEAA